MGFGYHGYLMKTTTQLLIPICALSAMAFADDDQNNDKNMPSSQTIQKAMDATSAKDPMKTAEALANCYTELAGVLTGIQNVNQANEHAQHVGMLVKQIIVLDKQMDAMEGMMSSDAEDSIENTYEDKIEDHKDKSEKEADRLQNANFYGSVALRRAMTGFDD